MVFLICSVEIRHGVKSAVCSNIYKSAISIVNKRYSFRDTKPSQVFRERNTQCLLKNSREVIWAHACYF